LNTVHYNTIFLAVVLNPSFNSDSITSQQWLYYRVCLVDLLARISNNRVLWEEQVGQAASVSHRISFTGVPFMILGWQILECSAGQPQKRKQQSMQAVSASCYTVCYCAGIPVIHWLIIISCQALCYSLLLW